MERLTGLAADDDAAEHAIAVGLNRVNVETV